MAFIHLQTHSHFSILRSSCRIKALLQQAKENGAHSLALTDHGNMFGIMEFYLKAQKENINPILGCHIFVDHPAADRKDETTYQRLTLLAENREGYYNLLKIVSFCYDDAKHWKVIPGVPLEIVQQNSNGLIALAGDYFSRFGNDVITQKTKAAKDFLDSLCDIFDNEHCYFTLSYQGIPEQKEVNRFLAEYAHEKGRELVAVNNVHYLSEEDSKAHKVLRCIGEQKTLETFSDPLFPTDQFYFRTEEEMRALFPEFPEAIDNTEKIAARCHVKIWTTADESDMAGKSKYWPKFEIPEGFHDADDYLAHLCKERLPKRYAEITPEVQTRLESELKIIKQMQVAGYLLIVWDFINWSREQGIPVGPGRGSAVGSVVTYIIGITDIEPLQFDLLFERFLNPGRVSMPDIDTDFSDRDRGRVIQYVTNRYGAPCVSQIVTYGTLKMKQVINDVGRVLGIPIAEVREITKLLPEELSATLKMAKSGLDKSGKNKLSDYNPEPLMRLIQSRSLYEELWNYSEKLEDLIRQTGVHAAAIIISPVPMTQLAPVYRASPEDTPVIMYDKHYAEDIGLLKMDFLGLITLSMIQDSLSNIKKTRGIDLDIGKIPLDDPETYALLGKGLTVGVFQFESPGMQKYLKELHPTRISDLIAMNALYRPGPIEQIPKFIRRKTGEEAIDCYHKDLEPILSETYGVIVYQEQVMRIAQTLAGYSPSGADDIRRIMAKKMPDKLAKLEPEFFEKCEQRGYDRKLVQTIWDVLLPFCDYAFNKSHAAAYAYIAYQTAFLKAHYGPEFMAATMSAEILKTERIVLYLQECEKLGIQYLAPCVNRSEARFSVDSKGRILYGLAGIRNVGQYISEDIVEEREKNGPYKSLFDFCKRIINFQAEKPGKHSPLNRRTLESLILAGALDNMEESGSRANLYASIAKALNLAESHRQELERGQTSLFDLGGGEVFENFEKLEEAPEWQYTELLEKERDVIGTYISGHPLEEFRPELIGFASCSLAPDELNAHLGKSITVGGIITSTRSSEPISKGKYAGRTIGFGTIRDFHDTLSIKFDPDMWDSCRNKISPDDRVLLQGTLERGKMSPYELSVTSFRSLNEVRNKYVKYIHLESPATYLTESNLEILKKKMQEFAPYEDEPGAEIVFHVETETNNEHVLLARGIFIRYSQEFLDWLKKDFLVNKVWVSEKMRR